ncbi:helix-turn-helix transcriptional regulator [Vibrio astriarenae]|uniref:helix-turn-helix transcriptional regulator n=1 Tax=Vibrio astriarenae TaxID=1481923 RepID=UPI00373587BA
MTDEEYLKAISHRLETEAAPAAIITGKGELASINSAFSSIFHCDRDVKSFEGLDLDSEFIEQISYVQGKVSLQNKPLVCLIVVSDDRMKGAFYTRVAPLISPNGTLLGVESLFFDARVIFGLTSYLHTNLFYLRDDVQLSLDVSESEWSFTELQKTYIFFILRNFSQHQIAEVMNVHHSTVSSSIKQLKAKISKLTNRTVRTTEELKRVAIEFGMIAFAPEVFFDKTRIILFHHQLTDWMEWNKTSKPQ